MNVLTFVEGTVDGKCVVWNRSARQFEVRFARHDREKGFHRKVAFTELQSPTQEARSDMQGQGVACSLNVSAGRCAITLEMLEYQITLARDISQPLETKALTLFPPSNIRRKGLAPSTEGLDSERAIPHEG